MAVIGWNRLGQKIYRYIGIPPLFPRFFVFFYYYYYIFLYYTADGEEASFLICL